MHQSSYKNNTIALSVKMLYKFCNQLKYKRDYIFQYLFPMNNWLAPFDTILSRGDNIALQWPLNHQVSLLLYWLVLTLIRALGTFTTCVVCTFISKISKKQITAIILCIASLFLPIVLIIIVNIFLIKTLTKKIATYTCVLGVV